MKPGLEAEKDIDRESRDLQSGMTFIRGRPFLKIGLTRHFPVPHNWAAWLSSYEFQNWIDWYDHKAEVRSIQSADVTEEWDVCYSSSLGRAKFTARALYKNPIIIRNDLKEVPFAVFPFSLSLPVMAWQVLSRIGWWAGMKFQIESRAESLRRAAKVIHSIMETHPGKNILMVTHGFFMQYLKKELHRHGFSGSMPIHPQGGIIHTFERREA